MIWVRRNCRATLEYCGFPPCCTLSACGSSCEFSELPPIGVVLDWHNMSLTLIDPYDECQRHLLTLPAIGILSVWE
jgi:hypothetical protein